ncbi:MAG: FtsW/RodA/SpoVE family cell cycle protein [Eggerthellaceae bacterium]|jgi:cell division protein FtsW
MASSAAQASRKASRSDRGSREGRRGDTARSRFRLRTPFSGEGVPAQIMGPRLLVVVSAMALTILGLVMVYSASSIEAITENGDSTYYLVRQLGFAAVGVAAIIVCVKLVPFHEWLNRVGIVYYVICMILVVLTAAMGLVGLGAQRWVSIGGITLQPSEFAKIAFLLATTRFMLEWRNGDLDTRDFIIRMAVFVLVPLAFMFKAQSDLGTTMICLVGILTILWVGEIPLRVILGIIGVVVLFAALASTVGYRQDRFIFLDPWSDYYGSGFQIIHSFYAFAQGGLFGTGLGNSAEKYLYLPEAETDFIFSIIGEELGLVGALAVVALFLAFLIGGLRMAQTASDEAGRLICSSLTVMLVFQAFLNMGMCIGVLPTTGKPLPFISAGGSSLIASLLIVGIMLSVSYSTDDSAYVRKRENLRLLHVEDDDGRQPSRRPRPHSGSLLGGISLSVGERAGSSRSTASSRRGASRGSDRAARGERAERTGRSSRAGRGDRAEGRPSRTRGDSRAARDRDTREPRSRTAGRSSERGTRRDAGRDAAERNRSNRSGDLHIVNDYHVPSRGRSAGSDSPRRRPGQRM